MSLLIPYFVFHIFVIFCGFYHGTRHHSTTLWRIHVIFCQPQNKQIKNQSECFQQRWTSSLSNSCHRLGQEGSYLGHLGHTLSKIQYIQSTGLRVCTFRYIVYSHYKHIHLISLSLSFIFYIHFLID